VEELLAPILAKLTKCRDPEDKLKRFVELFGGNELLCDGGIELNTLEWFGSTGFAIFYDGFALARCPEPPKTIELSPSTEGIPYMVFAQSTMQVASVFRYADQEYVVVCNELDGRLLRRRMLFCAMLREAVEKLAREAAEKTEK